MNIDKRWLLMLCFCLLALNNVFGQVDKLTATIQAGILKSNVNDNNISKYLSEQYKEDGSWSDIDYSSTVKTNWPPSDHIKRLKELCIAYNSSKSKFYQDSELKSKIQALFNYYNSKQPVSTNWWWQAIGVPLNYAEALIIMKRKDSYGFDQATLVQLADQGLLFYQAAAKKYPMATTGTNQSWLLKTSIAKACINNDETEVKDNFDTAFANLKIFEGKGEGIKIDKSFAQHGLQLYTYGYGRVYLDDITYYLEIVKGTYFEPDSTKTQLMIDLVLDGFQWFDHKKAFDFGANGREISRKTNSLSSTSLKTSIERLLKLSNYRINELKYFLDYLSGKKSTFQSPGNKHFWKADMMVQHGANFYLSAKTPSNRTIGTESGNDENIKSKYLPWGATNIMVEGNEYQNLMPVWDWARIPGVTNELEEVMPYKKTGFYTYNQTTNFAGGVSNSTFGLTVYDYKRDSINAKKAYFFTPDGMYCMGTSIASLKKDSTNPIITSVNQCKSVGKVFVNNGIETSTFNDEKSQTEPIKWVHHNKVGYYFPEKNPIQVINQMQSGSWYDINRSQDKTLLKEKVFGVIVNHGNKPSNAAYEYIVVPDKNIEDFEKFVQTNPFLKLANSNAVQAVVDVKNQVFAYSFYSKSQAQFDNKFTISVDKPCLILIQKKDKESYQISVADPSQTLEEVVLTISKKLSGKGIINSSNKETTIKFSLPKGDEKGKTITEIFN